MRSAGERQMGSLALETVVGTSWKGHRIVGWEQRVRHNLVLHIVGLGQKGRLVLHIASWDVVAAG